MHYVLFVCVYKDVAHATFFFPNRNGRVLKKKLKTKIKFEKKNQIKISNIKSNNKNKKKKKKKKKQKNKVTNKCQASVYIKIPFFGRIK